MLKKLSQMKNLKLLNRKYLSILLIVFLLSANSKAEDNPVDIWNIDKDKIETTKSDENQNNNEVLISEETLDNVMLDYAPYSEVDEGGEKRNFGLLASNSKIICSHCFLLTMTV